MKLILYESIIIYIKRAKMLHSITFIRHFSQQFIMYFAVERIKWKEIQFLETKDFALVVARIEKSNSLFFSYQFMLNGNNYFLLMANNFPPPSLENILVKQKSGNWENIK